MPPLALSESFRNRREKREPGELLYKEGRGAGCRNAESGLHETPLLDPPVLVIELPTNPPIH